MKIGFLLCAYNQEEHIFECLKNLVKFSKDNGHLISAVSVPFAEYKDFNVEVDNTTSILKEKLNKGDIDYLVDEPKFISEAEARTAALKPLITNCDTLFLIDADEVFSYEDFENIVNFTQKDPFIDWYSISYKNYVGDGYLKEPFCPPRIFKMNCSAGKLARFYYDNDVVYEKFVGEDRISTSYKELSSKNVMKSVANPKHYSWTNTEKNRLKIEYQKTRWGENGCGYKWDEKRGVIFNENFYKENSIPLPKIILD